MEKQVVALLGGKRDGNTHNLLKFFESQLNQNGINLEIIHLNEKDLKDCKGCENCVLGDGCAINDDFRGITNLIEKKDGLIVASPVYNNNVSGKMKMFIDRTVKWAHSPILTGKPYIGLSTTSSSGLKMTLKYLTIVGVNWGAHPIGNIWASKRSTNMRKNKVVLSRFISAIKQDPKNHHPNLKQVIKFQTKKVLAKTVFPNDLVHWQKNEWLDKGYYYKSKINLFNRLIGAFFQWMFLKIMLKAIKNYKEEVGVKEYGKLIYK
ncbi:flavodoxin family protein [Promethearchaeum syntrophicum]|uniref:Flavodoxin family protein n=1 Tax=Promethearchaeum syntrophicum TaxID=2594042 RepID=A0A5B9DD90_9ARCH|nr:flavodoxin family protein [Candidatus Prometheoarchaeum syntrophicum]QEE17001.1 Iron-sulfur flavoprotein [Candidatus Prometheoarchaeum syntrophicum]